MPCYHFRNKSPTSASIPKASRLKLLNPRRNENPDTSRSSETSPQGREYRSKSPSTFQPPYALLQRFTSRIQNTSNDFQLSPIYFYSNRSLRRANVFEAAAKQPPSVSPASGLQPCRVGHLPAATGLLNSVLAHVCVTCTPTHPLPPLAAPQPTRTRICILHKAA